jgi:hypothetical protein
LYKGPGNTTSKKAIKLTKLTKIFILVLHFVCNCYFVNSTYTARA